MEAPQQPAIMPAYPGLDEPMSMIVARVVRAGLIRRAERLLARSGQAVSDEKIYLFDRNWMELGTPATGLQPPEVASFFQRWWPVVRRHTSLDRFRAEAIVGALWQTRQLAGDIVECGSHRCGTGYLCAFAVREWRLPKRVHLYDSFAGLPPLTERDRPGDDDTMFYAGQFQEGSDLDAVRAFLREHELTDLVELHRGWFDQTLPTIPAGQRFSAAHIDCDLYESARTCLTYLTPHMEAGAALVIDDYDSHGMYDATWEFLDALDAPVTLRLAAVKQAQVLLPDRVAADRASAAPSGVRGAEDWSPLLANRPYRAYLAALFAETIQYYLKPPLSPSDDKLIATLNRVVGPERAVPFLEYMIGFLYRREATAPEPPGL